MHDCWMLISILLVFDSPSIEYQGLFYIGFEGFVSTIIVTFFTSDLCQTVECANGKNKYGGCGNCYWPVAAPSGSPHVLGPRFCYGSSRRMGQAVLRNLGRLIVARIHPS